MSATGAPSLTPAELEALHVLIGGVASRGKCTESDHAAGIHRVHSRTAAHLIERGFAREVPQWRGVEITAEGVKALGRYAHLRSSDRVPR